MVLHFLSVMFIRKLILFISFIKVPFPRVMGS